MGVEGPGGEVLRKQLGGIEGVTVCVLFGMCSSRARTGHPRKGAEQPSVELAPLNSLQGELMLREVRSGRAARFDRFVRRLLSSRGTWVGVMEANQDFVHRVLKPSVRLVQLAGSLAGKLTKLVAVGHMRECTKNQIRTHDVFLLHIQLPAGTHWRRRFNWLTISTELLPQPSSND